MRTGTNALHLAQHALTVVGVDFAPQAIAHARQKTQRAGIAVDFHVADVTRLDALGVREPFDFVLDIGCLHNIAAAVRARYAERLAQLTRPGSVLMLHTLRPRRMLVWRVGMTDEDMQRIRAPEATVYWIAILVILIGGEFIAVLLNATPASTMGPQSPVIAIVWAVIGYFCWRLKRWAFPLAAVAAGVA